VAVVAPVGVQEAAGAVAAARVRPALDVQAAGLDPGKQAVPAGGPGADPELDAVLREHLHAVEVEVRLVPPVEQDQVAIDLGDALGVLVDDVAPDHHALAVAGRQLLDPPDVLEVHAAGAELRLARLRLPAAQVPGLVAVRVQAPGAEVRQVLVVQVPEQLVGARLGRGQRPAVPGLVEVRVFGVLQHVGHVPERLQAGDQLDAAVRRVGVELAHRLGVERRILRADPGMAPEAEGVLGVEHQHVQLGARAQIDDLADRLGFRDLAARDVEHDAAEGDRGGVLDAAGGHPAAGVDELAQGLDPPAESGRGAGRDLDPLRRDRQPVRLPRQARIGPQGDVRAGRHSFAVALDDGRDADPRQLVPERQRGGEVDPAGPPGEHDRGVVDESEPPGFAPRAAGSGKHGGQGAGRHGASLPPTRRARTTTSPRPNKKRPGRLLARSAKGGVAAPGADCSQRCPSEVAPRGTRAPVVFVSPSASDEAIRVPEAREGGGSANYPESRGLPHTPSTAAASAPQATRR